ncbi:MAG: hypothetical protein GY928_07630 [Colwellia sp.]|nr:hypothetical protein [Colwellia sp.]
MSSVFKARFPSIENLEVSCEVKVKGLHLVKSISFSHENVEDMIYCDNSDCMSGGIRLFDMVGSMIEKNEINQSFSPICKGYEVINQQKHYCDQQFLVNVEING